MSLNKNLKAKYRGGSRAVATTKMERFVIIVNGISKPFNQLLRTSFVKFLGCCSSPRSVSEVEKRTHHKKLAERKRIDNQFFYNPQKVYRSMKGDAISIEKAPTKEDVESFWKGIWQKGTIFNDKADWLPQLEKKYCNNVTATEYNINRTILDKVIQKIQINKAPGNDRIIGYWHKLTENLLHTEIIELNCSSTRYIQINPYQTG